MHAWARYLILVLAILVSLHYILRFTQEDYDRATSFHNIASVFNGGHKDTNHSSIPEEHDYSNITIQHPGDGNTTLLVDRRANATFVILARNSDVQGTVRSIREIEDRFNKKYGYPYVLLNEEEFTDDFKNRVSVVTGSLIEFGVIPKDHWYQPDWIDEERAKRGREKMEEERIIYGGKCSVSYRNMCRFNSGFFFKHPLMQKYRWYWRIEPDVHFHCDLDFDPFLYMEDRNKIYAFTITMYEFEKTISTLWGHVKDFIKLHPEFVAQDNAMNFISDNDGDTYNLCHFWSNFEIADMNFWRGPAYTAFFEYLDLQGGFYYERWGDAPVHSIAAGLFARKDQIQFFNEIGYEHNPYTHCPQGEDSWKKGRCTCDPTKSFDHDGYSCMHRWNRFIEG